LIITGDFEIVIMNGLYSLPYSFVVESRTRETVANNFSVPSFYIEKKTQTFKPWVHFHWHKILSASDIRIFWLHENRDWI